MDRGPGAGVLTESGRRHIRLVVAYDGTGFHGWQEQPGLRTVQAALSEALEKMTGARPCTRAASRTDAGVHADGQVVTFRTDSSIPCDAFARGLSSLLRPEIVVREASEVPDDFEVRRAAGKHYRYRVLAAGVPSPVLRHVTWWVRTPLDLVAMREGAAALVGRHDFAAFRSSSCARKTTVRTVTRLDVTSADPEIHFDVEGDAFLMNMVRILTGTLVDVGRGRIPAAHLAAVRDSLDRRRAGRTAPAHGLTLLRVHYPEAQPR